MKQLIYCCGCTDYPICSWFSRWTDLMCVNSGIIWTKITLYLEVCNYHLQWGNKTFCNEGATCCTDEGQIWRGEVDHVLATSPLPKFTPVHAGVGFWAQKATKIKIVFHCCFAWFFFTKFTACRELWAFSTVEIWRDSLRMFMSCGGLRWMGPKALTWLDDLFIRMSREQRIPKIWRQAKIIALAKPGKDLHLAASYPSILPVTWKPSNPFTWSDSEVSLESGGMILSVTLTSLYALVLHLCLTRLPEVAMPYSDMWQDAR